MLFTHHKWRAAVGAVLVGAMVLIASPAPAAARTAADAGWVASWAASPVAGSPVPGSTCPAGAGLREQTVRNVVFLSAGGDQVRVRVTNAFGDNPLQIGHATVAVQSAGANARPGTVRDLTFDGARSVTVPAGAEMFSDPVDLHVAALSKLLVSTYLPGPTGPLTNHPFTAQTNYLADGDLAGQASGLAYRDTPCWMVVGGVDVPATTAVRGAVVAFGDSITDTASTTGNADQRWPDHLARRLHAKSGNTMSVVNAGLGGNRLLAERPGQPYYGVAGLRRLDRDVFAQSGVRTMILLEGINDIGYNATAQQLIDGYSTVIDRAHAHGVRVIGATLTPFKGSAIWTEERGRTWARVNTWIRESGKFDAVVDFAAATADPGDPLRLRPEYDSGDGLHPGDAGTRAMAAAIDLGMLTACRSDRVPAGVSARGVRGPTG